MRHFAATVALLAATALTPVPALAADGPLLLRHPTISKTAIVFSFAGDLWIVGRDGGDARRLTAGAGIERDPVFSPDGTEVAFTGEYDGNVDVFVVAAGGGTPRRLTYHPGADEAVGWNADGTRVLFRSSQSSYSSAIVRLFTVPPGGGFPAEIPLTNAADGALSPDGTHIAYVPNKQWQKAWKRYRGGQVRPIWIAALGDSAIDARVPREGSDDFNPIWVGDTVYFLSDRSGPVSLFAYDTRARAVKPVVTSAPGDFDIKSASAGAGAIVYERLGTLHVLDLASGADREVHVRIAADLPEVRPHFQAIDAKRVQRAAISPTGARAVLGVRGEIVTVPVEKGDSRNLTRTPAVMEREPAWSPDGRSIAYFSDESGEYALHVRNQDGSGPARAMALASPATFPYQPVWSPDSTHIAYSDKRLDLWMVDVDKKTAPVRIDSDTYAGPYQAFDPAWSPDGRWLAYTKQLRNYLHAVFLYSVDQGKSVQVTDGMSDARYPVFDRNGKYLYLTASTDTGLRTGWLDMSSLNHPVTRSVYVLVLAKDVPSPLAPESDEEKPNAALVTEAQKEHDKERQDEKPVHVRIDVEGIGQRLLALPIPARNYTALASRKTGVLFLVEGPAVDPLEDDGPGQTLHQFELATRKTEKLLEGIGAFDLSFNGARMLYLQKDQWFIVAAGKPTDGPRKPGDGGPLDLGPLQVYADPRAEWRHMFAQVWRDERDFLYDPGLHGLDLAAVTKRYEPFLDGIASRDDLNYLFEDMLGELTIGHMFVGGGDRPEPKKVKGGLLGADFTIENGRYRFARVYGGENWNPRLRAPLTEPGVNVTTGEYLLGVDGRELRATDNVFAFFEETAGRQVALRVGPSPDGTGARQVTVVPVEDDVPLRNLAWVEGNRRRVDEMSGGRVAYIYLPDTYAGGFTNFNRYFFAQIGKEAAIIDERFNGGGDIADYVIDYLRRPLLNYFTMREGRDITTPTLAIFGPKVMITNEMAGSGGDAMPWMFRKAGLGPLVGTRTWGGLVGHYTNPGDLIDGGYTGTPNLAFYTAESTWEIENHGVAPDVEVELDPKAVRAGHDPQLEKAIAVVLDLLAKSPPPSQGKRPAYPKYH